jgi:hypothetical protein
MGNPQHILVLHFSDRRVFRTKCLCLYNYPNQRKSSALYSDQESMAQRHGCTRCGTSDRDVGS